MILNMYLKRPLVDVINNLNVQPPLEARGG